MITIEKFKEALRTVASQEFAHIPMNPPKHIFSRKYDKKIQRLLNSVSKHGKAPLGVFYKAVLIPAACLIIFITSVTQIKAIREPFFKLLTTIYEAFIEVDFTGNGSTYILQEYQLNYVPEEYTLTDKQVTPTTVYYKYENSIKNAIIFTQKSVQGTQISIDNENGILTTLIVSDMEILLYKSDFSTEARWTQEGYYMSLTCIGDFDEETITKMIESVNVVDDIANTDIYE